ncbi:hypothetical protein OCA23_30535 [Bacillus cereus]|nr:hypothetical protein [Bacillus cereus]
MRRWILSLFLVSILMVPMVSYAAERPKQTISSDVQVSGILGEEPASDHETGEGIPSPEGDISTIIKPQPPSLPLTGSSISFLTIGSAVILWMMGTWLFVVIYRMKKKENISSIHFARK